MANTDSLPAKTWTLSEVLKAAPTKTLAAAAVLGLMWGPILATILDASDRISAAPDTSPDGVSEAPTEGIAPDPAVFGDAVIGDWAAFEQAVTARSDDPAPDAVAPALPQMAGPGADIPPEVTAAREAAAQNDAVALENLRAMTRFHRLSVVPSDAPLP